MRVRLGMTLVEVVFATLVVGLMTALAAPKLKMTRERLSLEESAQTFARNLHRAQLEAVKLNRAVTVRIVGDTAYQIDGVTLYNLDGPVSFVSSSPDSVRFASFGPPVAGVGDFQLQRGGRTRTVRVQASGVVSVQ